MKKRLLAVQGPLQFITGYVAFSWDPHTEDAAEPVEDVLLLYDFLAPPEIEQAIADAIVQLTHTTKWSRIVLIKGEEMDAWMRQRYARSIESLHERLGCSEFDEICLARDHVGAGSPLLMNAYPGARKRAYGDSFGLVGQQASMKTFEVRSKVGAWWPKLRSLGRKLLLGAPRHVPFDEAVLTLPIDMSGTYFRTVPLVVPARQHVLDCVERLHESVTELSAYCRELCSQGSGPADRLYLLSNFTASSLSSFDQEVALYVDVITAHSPPGSTVYIKPHPRSSGETLAAVVNRVGPSHRVVVIDDARFGRMPIELWSELVRHCGVVAMFSTSAINMKYLYGKDVVLPLDAERIAKYVAPGKTDYIADGDRLIREAIGNLDTWDGQSVLWTRTA